MTITAFNDDLISVLIVDDVRPTRKLLRMLLRELAPFEILEAEDGVSAMDTASVRPFDVIICDYNLTDSKGVDVLRHIRSLSHTEDSIFIMITSDVDYEELQDAKQAGVDSYVLKPLNLDSLVDGLSVGFEQHGRDFETALRLLKRRKPRDI